MQHFVHFSVVFSLYTALHNQRSMSSKTNMKKWHNMKEAYVLKKRNPINTNMKKLKKALRELIKTYKKNNYNTSMAK